MQYLHPYFCGLRERRMVECFSIAVKLPFLALEKTAARPYFLPRKQPGCLFCRVFFQRFYKRLFLTRNKQESTLHGSLESEATTSNRPYIGVPNLTTKHRDPFPTF